MVFEACLEKIPILNGIPTVVCTVRRPVLKRCSLISAKSNQPPTAHTYLSETEKNVLEDLFSSLLSELKKYHPSGSLIFINLRLFQSLKLRILMEIILPISLKLNFTVNTLGGYVLIRFIINQY